MMFTTQSLFAILLLAFVATPAPSRADGPSTPSRADGLIVVELFTSEGCSSCPPADEFLSDLAQDKNLLPLSMHVDYWDYIGWKDPFASPEVTNRQRAYAKTMTLRYVYTPQMVVQGGAEGTGSDRRKIKKLIRTAQRDADKNPPVVVQLTRTGDERLRIHIGTSGDQPSRPADIYLITFERERTVQVKRGENRGRTLTHRNVVRTIGPVGSWTGAAFETTAQVPRTQTIPDKSGGPPPPRSAAVLVQAANTGAILGANVIALD